MQSLQALIIHGNGTCWSNIAWVEDGAFYNEVRRPKDKQLWAVEQVAQHYDIVVFSSAPTNNHEYFRGGMSNLSSWMNSWLIDNKIRGVYLTTPPIHPGCEDYVRHDPLKDLTRLETSHQRTARCLEKCSKNAAQYSWTISAKDKCMEPCFNLGGQMEDVQSMNEIAKEELQHVQTMKLMDVYPMLSLRPDAHIGGCLAAMKVDAHTKISMETKSVQEMHEIKEEVAFQTILEEGGLPVELDCRFWCMPGPLDDVNMVFYNMLMNSEL